MTTRNELYKVLVKAARRGEPCPSTTKLAFWLKTSNSSIRGALSGLKAHRLITLEKIGRVRVITISATGHRTWSPNDPLREPMLKPVLESLKDSLEEDLKKVIAREPEKFQPTLTVIPDFRPHNLRFPSD